MAVTLEFGLCFTVEGTVQLPGAAKASRRSGIQLLTRVDLAPGMLSPEKLDMALSAGAQVFETLHDATLQDVCNEIRFYTWDR